MHDRLLVTTEDVVFTVDSQTFRLRRVPHFANEERIMWLLEMADHHGHYWSLASSRMQITTGLYRWAGPGPERRRED